MEGIIMKDNKQIVTFFKTLDSTLVKINKIVENNRPPLNGERYVTDKELAQLLKISRRTLQEYRNNGILPYYQLGGKILYKESDVEKLLEDNYYKTFQEE